MFPCDESYWLSSQFSHIPDSRVNLTEILWVWGESKIWQQQNSQKINILCDKVKKSKMWDCQREHGELALTQGEWRSVRSPSGRVQRAFNKTDAKPPSLICLCLYNVSIGQIPWEGKGYPLQYSGLENSTDCIVHGVAKNRTQLRDFHFHFHNVKLKYFSKM